MTTRYGLTLPQRGAQFGATNLDELLDLARAADTAECFDSIWVGDNLLSRPRPDSLTVLGALAAVTDRARLGVGCMASFTLRDPLVFAYQWATLDQLSGGRMQLAACTGLTPGGVSAAEGAVFGIADRDRPHRLVDHLDLCRRLWAGETIEEPTRFHDYRGARLDVQPVQQPCPVWIAGNPRNDAAYERAAERAVRHSSGFMTNEVMPGTVDRLRPHLDSALARHGRDRADFTLALYHNVVIGPDRESALDIAHAYLVDYVGPFFTRKMAEAWTAVGTPEECAADLHRLGALGADLITLRLTSYDQQGQYRRLVTELMPLLTT